MAPTFNEEYRKALGGRGLALTGKRFAIQTGIDANARRESLEKILFGDGSNYGIVSILSFYYSQIYQGQGRKTSSPPLHDPVTAKTGYQADFALSVTPEGDGAGGLHPPAADNPSAGQDDTDTNSIWLTTHGLEDSPSGTGINQLIQAVQNTIGAAARENGDGRGPYAAQAAAEDRAVQDRGSGLLGLRTGNSEIYSAGTEPDLQWRIGRNGIDTPDDYSAGPGLISGLTDIRNGLDGMTSLFQTTLSALQGEGNKILSEFKVELPVSDIGSLNQAAVQFQGFSAEVRGHIDFFNQYSDPSPSAGRSAVNARLEDVKARLQAIAGRVNSRCDGLPGLMGDASSGLNKHLTHWAAEAVKKPDGPYAMILGAQTVLAMAGANLQKKDGNLSFFEKDRDFWMEPPDILEIYNRAVMNLDQSVNRFETDIIWNLIQAANKYKALSMPFREIPLPLSNDPWDESSGTWVVNKLESGFLNNVLTIDPPAETAVFRIISFDTDEGGGGDFQRMDSFNTRSKQTDIISGYLSFARRPCLPGPDGVTRSVVSFDGDAAKQIKERDFLWLNESGIAWIIGISDSNYMLNADYGEVASLRKLTGLYCAAV
jgi:hypothetical protein